MNESVKSSNTEQKQNGLHTPKDKQIIKDWNHILDQPSTLQLPKGQEKEFKQCRICLDNNLENSSELISPCKCTGTLKYVHQTCFRKWIEKQYSGMTQKNQENFIKKGVQCELCKLRLKLVFHYESKCCNREYFYKRYNQSQLTFYLFIAFYLVSFACLSFIAYFMATNRSIYNGDQVILIVLAVSLLFLVVTTVMVSCFFFPDFFVEKIWVLQRFQGKYRESISKTNEFIPFEDI